MSFRFVVDDVVDIDYLKKKMCIHSYFAQHMVIHTKTVL